MALFVARYALRRQLHDAVWVSQNARDYRTANTPRFGDHIKSVSDRVCTRSCRRTKNTMNIYINIYRTCVGIAWCESILLSAIDGWVQFAVWLNRFCFYFVRPKKSSVWGNMAKCIVFQSAVACICILRKTHTRECHIAKFCAVEGVKPPYCVLFVLQTPYPKWFFLIRLNHRTLSESLNTQHGIVSQLASFEATHLLYSEQIF